MNVQSLDRRLSCNPHQRLNSARGKKKQKKITVKKKKKAKKKVFKENKYNPSSSSYWQNLIGRISESLYEKHIAHRYAKVIKQIQETFFSVSNYLWAA